ncbi:hypothetical protein BGX23_008732 [Mortierella sp. AD031]|nr:hypothetical protein BGX23_008732 [Mortierella sp. AD031]
MGSGMSQSLQQTGQQQQQQSTIRSLKSSSATTSSTIKQAEENRRVEDAARTRRKIADLEISNASLLSINQTLEATIRKQTAEIQELKVRMQSAHYGDLGFTAADLVLAQSVEAIELTEEEKQDDLTFKRLCLSIEQMVYEAKTALDQCSKPAGVKVLSLYDMYEKEVKEEAEEEDDEDEDLDEDDANNVDNRKMSQRTFVKDDDDDNARDSDMKTKYSIEILAPQDDDDEDNSDRPSSKQNSHSQDASLTSNRRDSGLSSSSGRSGRGSPRNTHQNPSLFQETRQDGMVGLASSPHTMISSAVFEAPTIVS